MLDLFAHFTRQHLSSACSSLLLLPDNILDDCTICSRHLVSLKLLNSPRHELPSTTTSISPSPRSEPNQHKTTAATAHNKKYSHELL